MKAYYRVGKRARLHDTLASAEAASVLWWLHGENPEDAVIYRVVPCRICGALDCTKTHLLSKIMRGLEDL